MTTKRNEEEHLIIDRSAESTVIEDDEVPLKLAQLRRSQSTSFPKKYHDLLETQENVGATTMNQR